MKRRRGSGLSETQLGYLMVMPALLLVILITIWPVMLSFHNSLFDYRLNDPTRSEKITSSNILMESYADNHYYLEGAIDNAASSTENEEAAAEVEQFAEQYNSYHEELMSFDGVEETFTTVEEMLAGFENINDNELEYVEVDNEFAEEYKAFLEDSAESLGTYVEEGNEDGLENLQSYVNSSANSILESNFVGFENYIDYFQDSRMWASMSNTMIFTVASVFFELVIGLMVALLINRSFKGRGLVRASVLIPWAIPTAVSAMMWSYLYDGQSGIIAHYFEQLGFISDTSQLLSTGGGAMFSIIFADVWKTTPYMALLLLAGLQTIPSDMYEAAQVDGANRWQQFLKVTLPLLKSAILVALLFRTLDAFRVFDLIYVLTGGGPANSTESISVYAYKVLFAQQNFGEGSTLSVIVFLTIALLSVLFIKLIGSDLFDSRTPRK
ncbi:carbohydrate ABC transporter permease [Alteribacillus sp. HJP-4]|uniref:carbohydrate ABC transporter permease n=1 Tax=Alteribacillus sp. HJP-4 TaxID=2775394 RepID=UPI0035CD284D